MSQPIINILSQQQPLLNVKGTGASAEMASIEKLTIDTDGKIELGATKNGHSYFVDIDYSTTIIWNDLLFKTSQQTPKAGWYYHASLHNRVVSLNGNKIVITVWHNTTEQEMYVSLDCIFNYGK